eukprot:763008-Hanusia_phi.AAC.4
MHLGHIGTVGGLVLPPNNGRPVDLLHARLRAHSGALFPTSSILASRAGTRASENLGPCRGGCGAWL